MFRVRSFPFKDPKFSSIPKKIVELVVGFGFPNPWSWFSFSIKSIRLEDASAGRYFRRFGMKNHLFSKKSFHRKKLWYLNSSYSNKLFFGVFLSRKKMINDSLGKFFSELDWKKNTYLFRRSLSAEKFFLLRFPLPPRKSASTKNSISGHLPKDFIAWNLVSLATTFGSRCSFLVDRWRWQIRQILLNICWWKWC